MLSRTSLAALSATTFLLLSSLASGASIESLGVDLGNESIMPAEAGWVNVDVQPTSAPSTANTFVTVPLKKNGAAATSRVSVGSLFGRTVRLSMSARSSASGFTNFVWGGVNGWLWKENGKFHTTQAGNINAAATSNFNLPNNCEAFQTSVCVSSNGETAKTATCRLAFAGLAPGKAYTVTVYIGTPASAHEAVTLASGTSVSARPLGTSQGTLSGTTFTGAANATTNDDYLALEWTAQADLSGELVFDIEKLSGSNKGNIDVTAVTIATDDTPAPVLPEPKPAAPIHNKALTALPASVALPVPADTWSKGGKLTCELWVRADDVSGDSPILSLGSAVLSLKNGVPTFDAGGNGTPLASREALEEGVWHHVAVSLGTSLITLYVDGVQKAQTDAAAFANAARNGWQGIVLLSEFAGARDELRFWNTALSAGDDDFYLHGPLPMGHPKYGSLVGNWRLDGNLRDTKWTEFTAKTGSPFTDPCSALTPANAGFTIVDDNPVFRYKTTAAYVRDSHIIADWLDRSHMINNSDLIYIGGNTVASDGSIAYAYPDNDVTDLDESGVEFLKTADGRTNVYRFPSGGPGMHVGNGLISGYNLVSGAEDTNNFHGMYTIEANLRLAAGEQTFTLYGSDTVCMKVTWAGDHYRASLQEGTDRVFTADLPASIGKNGYFWLAFTRQNNKNGQSATFFVKPEGGKTQTLAAAESTADLGPLEGTANAVIGQNFAGDIDEMRVWHDVRGAGSIGAAIRPLWGDRLLVAQWGFSDMPGFDTASWVEHFRKLRRMTAGVEGMRFHIDIAGGEWKPMLLDAGKRENFAAAVAEAIERAQLDGVDLDFEWLYQGDTSYYNGYGELAKAIRRVNPGAHFSISLHTVAYWFPQSAMPYVDSFTFQNYGPAIDVNTYDSMVNACNAFRKQGFPDEKIILSAPFQGTAGSTSYIKLYRDFADNSEVADPNCDQTTYNFNDGPKTLHYNGVTTVKRKAKYIADQQLAGFMYWDLGGDVADKTDMTNNSGISNYWDARSLLKAANRYNASTAFPETPPVFALDRAGASVPAAASTCTVNVQAEDGMLGWVVSEKPAWVTIDTPGAIGNATVTISIADNETTAERSGTIVFLASSTNQRCSFTITQDAGTEAKGYDKWKKKHFPGGDTDPNAAPGANPAHDGITNLLKYALGFDPHQKYGSPGVPTVSSPTPPATLTVTYPRNDEATDILYSGERLADPDDVSKGWTAENVATDTTTPGKVSIHCELQNSVDSPKQILRLRVKRVETAE